MALRKIREQYNHNSIGDLCQRGIPVQHLHKQFQQHIIEQQAAHGNKEVAKELHPPPQVRPLKHNKQTQVKADGQRNGRGQKQGHDMRRNNKRPDMDQLFVQNIMVRDVIEYDAEQGIAAAAGRIMVGLKRHKAFEQRIKNIQHAKNAFFYLPVNPLHVTVRI